MRKSVHVACLLLSSIATAEFDLFTIYCKSSETPYGFKNRTSACVLFDTRRLSLSLSPSTPTAAGARARVCDTIGAIISAQKIKPRAHMKIKAACFNIKSKVRKRAGQKFGRNSQRAEQQQQQRMSEEVLHSPAP
jgi:hypothetical protein